MILGHKDVVLSIHYTKKISTHDSYNSLIKLDLTLKNGDHIGGEWYYYKFGRHVTDELDKLGQERFRWCCKKPETIVMDNRDGDVYDTRQELDRYVDGIHQFNVDI